MPVLIHFRDMSPKISLAALIFVTPMVLEAQRFGLSTGALGSQSTGAIPGGATTASAAQMPSLPRPLLTPSVVPLPSLQLTLKPLNLLSNHLAPPQINFAPDLRPVLPVLPFAIDPIAARSMPQMCVEPR
jgi:hypothetical protein